MPKHSSIEALQKENEQLRVKNQQLAAELSRATGKRRQKRKISWRALSIGMLVALSVLVLLVGNVLFWAGNTVAKTDRYVATVSPLASDTVIQQALATYVNDKLYQNVNVDQVITDALPPRANFLAEPLTSQLQNSSQKTLEKFAASPQFAAFWNEANQRAHTRLVSIATDYQGDGTINLSEVYQYLGQQLQNTKLSFLANKQLPGTIGTITVVQSDWLPMFHTLVTQIDTWRILTLLLLVSTAFGAVWLSRNKRKTIIKLAWLYTAAMFITLAGLRIGKGILADEVDPTYQQATQHAYQIIINPLRSQTATLLVVGLLIVFVVWLSGFSNSAVRTKTALNQIFTGNLHHALFGRGENSFTLWVRRHKPVLQWGSVGLICASVLVVRLTPGTLAALAGLMALLVLAVELLAAPPQATDTQ